MTDIMTLLAGYNISPRRVSSAKGGEYQSACPICGDGGKGSNSDRFHAWPDQNNGEGSWWCRQCGGGGDCLELVMRVENKSYPEACKLLGKELSDLPRTPSTPRSPVAQSSPAFIPGSCGHPEGVNGTLWQHKAGELVERAHAALMNNEDTLGWLVRRGIDHATVQQHRLGLVIPEKNATALFRPRKSWGLPEIKNEKTGRPRMLMIPRGIVIPCIVDDAVIRIRIRRPRADLGTRAAQKYFVIPGSRMDRTLVNAGARAFVIVETELDAFMVAAAAGDLVGAAAMGSSHAKPDTACHLAFEQALKILVALDFDHAGASAWPWWRDTYPQAVRWPVPRGKDPGDAFAAGVPIDEWVTAGLPPVMTLPDRRPPAVPPRSATVPDVPTEPDPGPRNDVPAPVRQLYRLLASYPVKVEARAKRLRVIQSDGWRNPEKAREISHLVFREPTVLAYLDAHPAVIINWRNFWSGKAVN